ncbi:MAG TPA: ABC transporter substrate-binding protein [Methylomirabilota bacterium]|nr:ABC transporter substrate-binding protein [Methylomirabilota bacterium]
MERREILRGLALATTAGLVGRRAEPAAAEPPPETRRLRVANAGAICIAPLLVAQELFPSEGFTDVSYVDFEGSPEAVRALAAGEVDVYLVFIGPVILRIDAGDPIVVLAGVHPGCFELFGSDRVRTIRDLKGKTVAVRALGSAPHVFISSIATYVGLNPRKDINWVTHPRGESMRLLSEGKIDAYMAFPPDAQEMRARRIGHVVVNSAVDRPWSQYFCCLLASNREFVQRHPVAAKRMTRAVIKAAGVCAGEPERVARFLVDRRWSGNYEYGLKTLRELSYTKWDQYDPEDAMRFYALRLHEAGMIKSTPQKIIERGTDWRFLNALKKELKG